MNLRRADRKPTNVVSLWYLGSFGEPIWLFWQTTAAGGGGNIGGSAVTINDDRQGAAEEDAENSFKSDTGD